MRQGKCSVILCIILLLLFFFPDSSPGNGPIIPFTVDNIVDTEIYALDLLVNSTYGDFEPEQEKWLNVTGLRESDGFAWNVLGSVKERVRDQVYAALGGEGGERALNGPIPGTEPLPVYGNISGYVQGTWVRSTLERELSKPHLNVTAILPRVYRPWDHFRRNITGDSGDVYITFKDKGNPDDVNGTHVRGLTADMTIADETSPGAGWSFVLYGEHVLDTGSIVLTTSSDK
jgi:transmembrane E3 ubiquitin-protein ligase